MPCPLMSLLVGATFAWLVQRLLGWCNVISVGALLALASGKAERRQVHPLESALTSVQICEIRGRTDIPTERTEHTEPLAEKRLTQMAQMFTDVGRHTKFALFA